jgi:hypothetical protein
MTSTGSAIARTLATPFVPATNLRGQVSGAGWLYATPRLAYREVLCVGAPGPASLAALVRVAPVVRIVEPSWWRRQRVARHVRDQGWSGVVVGAPGEQAAGGSAPDLLVATGAWSAGPGRAALATALLTLPDDGVVVLDAEPDAGLDEVLRRATVARRYAVGPAWGEVRSVVPLDEGVLREALRRRDLLGVATRFRHPRLAARERRLRRRLGSETARHGRIWTIAVASEAADGGVEVGKDALDAPVPAYLRSLAAAAGRDLAGWGWAVAARGEYDSQKVLVFLRPPGGETATGVVKITRSAEHAPRLATEALAVRALQDVGVSEGRVPVPWFDGSHAGRAILGTSLVEGTRFEDVATWDPDSPALADALGWLTDLGVATTRPISAATVGTALLALLDRYAALFPTAPAEVPLLRDRFERLAAMSEPVPTVLQHGDPGIWNLVIDASGRTGFLDWESAELDGLPLWDVLYLARSFGVAAARRRGDRDRLRAAGAILLRRDGLGRTLDETVRTYIERVGVPPEAVPALTYGCWVHRALKEATRLPVGRADRAFSARLLRLTLQHEATAAGWVSA